MFCSDSPACCELIQKTVQERRKDGGQDQPQDPNGFGVYLLRAGNEYEADKPDHTRRGTHRKGNKYADDNLLHDIPFSTCDLPATRTAILILRRTISALYRIRLIYQLFYSRGAYLSLPGRIACSLGCDGDKPSKSRLTPGDVVAIWLGRFGCLE